MTQARAVTGWPLRALGLGAGAALAAVATGLVVDPGRPAAGHVQNLELGLMRGAVTGLLIGPFAARLRLPARQRAALLLAYTFVLSALTNWIESSAYNLPGAGTRMLLVQLPGVLVVAALLTALYPPAAADASLAAVLGEAVRRRPAAGWAWRLAAAGLLFIPCYIVLGALITPWVDAYWTGATAVRLGLRPPPLATILLLEAGRGLLYAVTLLPVVLLMGGSRLRSAGWGSLTFCGLAAVPLLWYTAWPLPLRVAHLLEISGSLVAFCAVAAWLLGWRNRQAGRRPSPTPEPARLGR